jgi:asparaginyl-tRNA synthetase
MDTSYLDANITYLSELLNNYENYIEKMVLVSGWIKFFRVSGGKGNQIGFVKLNDGTGLKQLQIIFDVANLSEESKEYFDDIYKKGMTGMSIKVYGKIVKSPAKGQPIEMIAKTYQIIGNVMEPETYPITKNKLQLDFLRTIPHLRVRTDTFLAINRIKSVLRKAMADYFELNNFLEVQVPLITDNECESGACPFIVTSLPLKDNKVDFSKDFFKKQVYLTVSGQLHLEAIVCGGVNKAWTMTTAFRAEPSTGPKHLGEFWMAELEMCFSKLEDNMRINEECIKYCFRSVLEKCRTELDFFETSKSGLIKMLEKYVNQPFIITTHEECVRRMLEDIKNKKAKVKADKKLSDTKVSVMKDFPKYDDDLTKDHERYITEVLYEGMPVFVRYFPKKVKAFYMPVIDKGNEVEHVDGFDLLFPEIGEIVGGSQRISDYNELLERMKEQSIKPETLEFYTDLRKYGSIPHGGSGIGFDRLLLCCSGLQNIRDMVPFPRSFEQCYN